MIFLVALWIVAVFVWVTQEPVTEESFVIPKRKKKSALEKFKLYYEELPYEVGR